MVKNKKNELAIFEEFRIKLTAEEKEGVEWIKKEFKESKIGTTMNLMIGGIIAPFQGEGKKYYKDLTGDLTLIFKSSIRDAAIGQVSHNIRQQNKKANQYKKKDLWEKIQKEESRIKKQGRLKLLKTVIVAHLGIGVLPFV